MIMDIIGLNLINIKEEYEIINHMVKENNGVKNMIMKDSIFMVKNIMVL